MREMINQNFQRIENVQRKVRKLRGHLLHLVGDLEVIEMMLYKARRELGIEKLEPELK
jgi:hypothetical protein